MRHADELGLDNAQKEFIRSESPGNAGEKYPELQKNLQHEIGALGDVLHEEDHPDQQKAFRAVGQSPGRRA